MKKFLIKIVLFFVVVAVVDVCYGAICDYLRDHAKGGIAAKVHYIIEDCHEDVIMMGSSRMAHHYIPQIFEDSLGMTCYNAGFDGNGIILSYGLLKMILERYTPKLIIYDVSHFDMYNDDNSKFLDMMKPYYNTKKDCIAELFFDVNIWESLKTESNLYRYSSKFLRLLSENVHPQLEFEKGYYPMFRTMNYEPSVPENEELVVDSLKLKYLDSFVKLTRQHHIDLLFVASPIYFGNVKTSDNTPIKAFSKHMKVRFWDYYYDTQLSSSNVFWADPNHLNDRGAQLFSKMIVKDILKEFKKNQGRSL